MYFVREEFTRCVKIGQTKVGPSERMAALQIGCPSELTMHCAVLGPEWLESALHRICAPWRRRGEWFDDCPRMDAVIEVYQRHDGKRIPRSLEDATKSAYSYEDLMV